MAKVELKINGGQVLLTKQQKALTDLPSLLERMMLQQMDKTRTWAIENRMAQTPGPPGALLHVRTGHLRASIHPGATSSSTSVTGTLAVGVDYAEQHELGKTVTVPAHISQMSMAFGKSITPRYVIVRQHTATYPQRAFLKPSLDARREEILAALGYVIKGALT